MAEPKRLDSDPAAEVTASGITEPEHDVLLISDGVGRIEKVEVEEGQHVKQGQAVIQLDNTRQALEAERFRLVWQDKSRLTAARTKEEALKKLLDDARALFEKTKSISREELAKKELDYSLVKAEISQYRVEEKKEEVDYRLAQERLRQRTIFSPINGIVTKLFLEEGETTDARQPVVRIVDSSRCRFVCNVEERLGKGLKTGDKVKLRLGAKDSFISKVGTVVFVSPVVDPASSLLEVKVLFDNPGLEIRPGTPGFLVLTPPAN